MSLSTSPLTTIIPVTDAERSRKFYEDALGLPFRGKAADGNLVFTLAGAGSLALLSDPQARPSTHTAASFEVNDITDAIGDLDGHGVVFEDYDLPDLKTVDHICVLGSEKAAWFKDPDGNILCLHEDHA
ncbi:glyoxalase/bleomycin resistance/dioxygenase family protein [Paeniglutamicibacter psychrophenolicus]|uniref:Catechol 2,3-dioxygenase-like lactoylglutathione lyase family enzyme n=1 Tax=Paeniglutamicibacter psychrophenolicus TaxID=257454 RepID=A0ABS4WG47_9MICC|nr:VOC family protein [Paeniglutamicibacter psychrophenolicus]MBP2374918.1 catechol 2,3-dioxygenase-like lactoylglutathione lyase family enzyme [Paeniglutamicibacter psychrophenolicus]